MRFASAQGTVQVTAGNQSVIVADGIPSIPESCQADQLMAWAMDHQPDVRLPEHVVDVDLSDLVSIPQIMAGRPIFLESLDRDKLFASKREWLKKRFPSIPKFLGALAEEVDSKSPTQDAGLRTADSAPSFLQLLLESGDLRQIVYPVGPVLTDPNFLLGVAQAHGFDRAWFSRFILLPDRSYSKQQGMVSGVDALEKWLSECRALQNICDSAKRCDVLWENTRAMGEYLETTRALLWVCIQDGMLIVPDDHKVEILDLLREQVALAYECKELAWHLDLSKPNDCSGCDEYFLKLIQAIKDITDCERKIEQKRATFDPTYHGELSRQRKRSFGI